MIYIFQVRIHPQGKVIKFKTTQLCNELPTRLKTTRSPNTYKYQLKSYLLNKLNTK